MSEQILKALMELFAIIARPVSALSDQVNRRPVVESFLRRQLNQELVDGYLMEFDNYFELHQNLLNKRGDKRISAVSVKILRICQEINVELTQKQKFIVLVHLFEFVSSASEELTNQETEFIEAVSDSFNISREEHDLIREYTINTNGNLPDSGRLLLVDNKQENEYNNIKHMLSKQFRGQLRILHIQSDNLFFIRYLGKNELYLNGQLLDPEKVYVFHQGSSIRDHNTTPIYYSDVASLFHTKPTDTKIEFEAKNISYKFKNGAVGLHPLGFSEESGKLVGIMGASGAGKSTLLNVLNGSSKPHTGQVLINAHNIYEPHDTIDGLIGFVSQDDLLIEELTVWQNLYYNAKLCFGDYTEEQITECVEKTLHSLGLYEARDIQVGSPLNKKISGGQRKRLNIALELIREPSVLFLDEPTSGLSSRDSENIMDLLKELSLKGKLVFVVIHQPSSDIFKMFDKLLILDTGGYLIYEGDPIESILYFKSKIHHANYNESECQLCGNVNPEQIFNIVEANVLDEYGKFTTKRKISPNEWYSFYREDKVNTNESEKEKSINLPKIQFKPPNLLRQFLVFVKRDVISKLSNTQYLVINSLEAPLLAFILSFIIKYHDVSETNEFSGYTFIGNSNLPVYIFMSVIVAIFMGLTVSAEEIIKDRKILKREAFLNLSWFSYLFSKISVLIFLSAIQSLTFVLIGNSILEIKGMIFHYWIILFSCWVAANLMGLLISDSFKTVVTIYILIPFLVIPQIVLSGIIVKYEKLNPSISSPDKIPFYGEIITARWGYEALAVHQYKDNEYMKMFYGLNKVRSDAEYKLHYWKSNMKNKVDALIKNYDNRHSVDKFKSDLTLIRHEIEKENEAQSRVVFKETDMLYIDKVDLETLYAVHKYIEGIHSLYTKAYNRATKQKDKIIRSKQKEKNGRSAFNQLKRDYHNDKLASFVENSNEEEKIIEYKGKLIQKLKPIYLDPDYEFVRSHFYAPRKMIFGKYYDTFWVNTIVIWFMSLCIYLCLYLRLLKKLLDYLENKAKRLKYTNSKY